MPPRAGPGLATSLICILMTPSSRAKSAIDCVRQPNINAVGARASEQRASGRAKTLRNGANVARNLLFQDLARQLEDRRFQIHLSTSAGVQLTYRNWSLAASRHSQLTIDPERESCKILKYSATRKCPRERARVSIFVLVIISRAQLERDWPRRFRWATKHDVTRASSLSRASSQSDGTI